MASRDWEFRMQEDRGAQLRFLGNSINREILEIREKSFLRSLGYFL